MLKLVCKNCGKDFTREARLVEAAKRRGGGGGGLYCSSQCAKKNNAKTWQIKLGPVRHV